MKRLWSNKSGISVVISSILMILITVVGMGIVFAFVAGYCSTYQTGVGSSVMESLTVEDIWLQGNNGAYNNTAVIAIYNSGNIDTTINGIYVNGNATYVTGTNFNLNINVPVGQHVIVTVQGPVPWQSYDRYDFKVSTTRGSVFDQSISAS